jgi:hypothetical protein
VFRDFLVSCIHLDIEPDKMLLIMRSSFNFLNKSAPSYRSEAKAYLVWYNNNTNIYHNPTTKDRATSATAPTTDTPQLVPSAADVELPGAAADAEPLALAD